MGRVKRVHSNSYFYHFPIKCSPTSLVFVNYCPDMYMYTKRAMVFSKCNCNVPRFSWSFNYIQCTHVCTIPSYFVKLALCLCSQEVESTTDHGLLWSFATLTWPLVEFDGMSLVFQVIEEEFSHTVIHRRPLGIAGQRGVAPRPAKAVIRELLAGITYANLCQS